MDALMKNTYHELVRDLFVFSVFTGLAYSDVKNLTADRLQTFFDGNPTEENQHRIEYPSFGRSQTHHREV